MTELAFDSFTLGSRPSVRHFDENGFLHVDISPVTSVQVAPYRGSEIPGWRERGLDPDRVYHAYRPADELSKPATVESLNGIPIQLEHHPDYASAPAKETRIGSTGTDAKFDDPYLCNSLHFQDEDAIRRIKDGSMKELSLGYGYTPDFTPGEWKGQHYDFVMRNIRANHVALVEQGRAGPRVCVEDAQPKDLPMDEKDQLGQAANTLAKGLVDLTAPKEPEQPAAPAATNEETPAMDENASIEQICKDLADAGLDPEKIPAIKAKIAALAAPAQDEEPEDVNPDKQDKDLKPLTDAADDDGAEEPGKKDQPAAEDEDDAGAKPDEQAADEDGEKDDDALVADAIKSCGLDAENPAIKEAFTKGAAYARGQEKPEAEDEDDPGEKPAQAQDSAARVAGMVRRQIAAQYAAADECRKSLGRVRATAYDSAGDIYRAALRAEGVSSKGMTAREARTAYRALMMGRSGGARAMAQDSAMRKPGSGLDAFFNRVHLGD